MANLIVQGTEFEARGPYIRKLLAPLSHQSLKDGPAWNFAPGPRATKVIAVHDGQRGTHYREWSFPTVVKDLRSSYFEMWREAKRGRWYLHCAYLTLILVDRINFTKQDYFCLHCDPYESDDAAHAIYKQSPHVHIERAEAPLPKAHIPLTLGHKEYVLSSIENFNDIFKQAIQMIRHEILDARMELQ